MPKKNDPTPNTDQQKSRTAGKADVLTTVEKTTAGTPREDTQVSTGKPDDIDRGSKQQDTEVRTGKNKGR